LCVEAALRGGRAWWVAPSYKMAAVGWRGLRMLAQQIPGTDTSHSERLITFFSGGTAQVRSADDPNSLRGDGLNLAVLDECAYMKEAAWSEALRPALSDRKGGALFISTPHGLNWFRDLWRLGENDEYPDWQSWTFKTSDNPFIDPDEIEAARRTLLGRIFRQEYEADFLEDNPGALWRRAWIKQVIKAPELQRIVIAVDPSVTSTGDEWGIIAVGVAGDDFYVLEDASIQGSPRTAAQAAISLYHKLQADVIVAEKNQGGEMITVTFETVDRSVPVRLVHASRGKQTRAEPISVIYEQGRGYHVGAFPQLEDEMCQWEPGQPSPNRMDALVWGGTELMLGGSWLV